MLLTYVTTIVSAFFSVNVNVPEIVPFLLNPSDEPIPVPCTKLIPPTLVPKFCKYFP